MNKDKILAMINTEIDRLTRARDLLLDRDSSKSSRRGRPPKSSAKDRPIRRKMSAAARKKISAKMKKSWADRKAGKK